MKINTIEKNGKTVHQVMNTMGVILGYIRHEIKYQRFVYKPEFETMYNEDDLLTIVNKLTELNK